MYAVDGLIKDEILEKMIEFIVKATKEEVDALKTSEDFAARFVSYIEAEVTSDDEKVVTSVFIRYGGANRRRISRTYTCLI